MATYYSNQYQDAFVDVPSDKIRPGDQSGKLRFMFFDFTVPSVAPSNADFYLLGKIPKGARVVEAVISFPDLGGSGSVDLGWAASAELDSAGSAVEAADVDGFLANVDLDTAADTIKMTDNAPNPDGFLKKFSAECDLKMIIDDAWSATSGVVKGYLAYVIV